MSQTSDGYHQAIDHYRHNRFEAALTALAPLLDHPDALNLAAACEYALNRSDEALARWQRVIADYPRHAGARNNLGNYYEQLGRLADAEAMYRQALELEAHSAEASYNLGRVLARQGHAAEAEQSLRRAAELRPDLAAIHSELGELLAAQERFDEAERALRTAIELAPRKLTAHQKLVELLDACGRFDEMVRACRHVTEIAPDSSDAWFNLGMAIHHATARARLEQIDEAEDAFRRAIALRPEATRPYLALGDVLGEDPARIDETIALFRHAVAKGDCIGEAEGQLATALLRTGRYAEAWPLMEGRYDARWPARPIQAPELPFPRWQGESLAGKSLLVIDEQGHGDRFQFCRYLPMLKALEPAKVAVLWSADDPFHESIAGADACFTPASLPSAPSFDCWCFLMSLPALMGTTLDTVPNTVPYLFAAQARIDDWRTRLPSGAPKVGVVWMGEPRPHMRDDFGRFSRCWASAREYSPLLAVPGVRFVNLQKGETARRELAALPSHLAPFDPMGDAGNFADTAAIIMSLDLVITIDTSIAHLAGALGKPVWILLQRKHDWRWLLDRDDSPWYPTARLFRQTMPNEWDDVIERVREALIEWRDRN